MRSKFNNGPHELVDSIAAGTYERDNIVKSPHSSLKLSF